jgi:acyl-CoA oxidase
MQKDEIETIGILKKYHADSTAVLKDMLFGDDLKKRDKWHKVLQDPIFYSKYQFDNLDEERELAFKRLKKIADAKLFSIFDFENDPINLFTAHE